MDLMEHFLYDWQPYTSSSRLTPNDLRHTKTGLWNQHLERFWMNWSEGLNVLGPSFPKLILAFLDGVLKVISTFLASTMIFMLDCAWGKQVALSIRDVSSFWLMRRFFFFFFFHVPEREQSSGRRRLFSLSTKWLCWHG